MPDPRRRTHANSGGEVTQATKRDTRPHPQPPRQGDSQDGELSDVDDDTSAVQPEHPPDPVSYSYIIYNYVEPVCEVIVGVIVIYLFYVHLSSPDTTERALLDVLKEKCGKGGLSKTRTCIESLLKPKISGKMPAEPVTKDCSHPVSEYENLEQTVERLQKWTEGMESVFEDPRYMSGPLRNLKAHHRHLETVSSAGNDDDMAVLRQGVADVKTVKESVEGIKKTLKETNTNLNEFRTTLNETNTKLRQQEDRISQVDKKQINVAENVIPSIKSHMGEIQEKAAEAKRATDTNGRQINVHIEWAKSAYQEFKEHRESTNKKVEEFAGKHDAVERKLDGEELDGAMTKAELSQLKGKSTLHDMAFYLALLDIIAVVMIVMYVRQTLSSEPTAAAPVFHHNTQRDFSREEVYELSWKGPMENSLCVVTFHTETEVKHADQTRSVFESVQQPSPTIHTRVIRCHADIKQLPGSRVFLVFVDFNERNVILEDPTKGLGDLRVTTVRSLWRFGADVTVIYCGDRRSSNLGGGLFNQDLGSIHRQTELKLLRNDGRILSIYDDFNNTQKQHCRNYINRLLHIAH
ncbi:uncharacterized protein [Haliotis asinina]|uniref:uncharacterized protein n=1 Tax=Haliotis asinina TaxID=109174 RepID=UPI0035322A80